MVVISEQVNSDDYNMGLHTRSFHFIKIVRNSVKTIVMTKKFLKIKCIDIEEDLAMFVGGKQVRKHTEAAAKGIYSAFIE